MVPSASAVSARTTLSALLQPLDQRRRGVAVQRADPAHGLGRRLAHGLLPVLQQRHQGRHRRRRLFFQRPQRPRRRRPHRLAHVRQQPDQGGDHRLRRPVHLAQRLGRLAANRLVLVPQQTDQLRGRRGRGRADQAERRAASRAHRRRRVGQGARSVETARSIRAAASAAGAGAFLPITHAISRLGAAEGAAEQPPPPNLDPSWRRRFSPALPPCSRAPTRWGRAAA